MIIAEMQADRGAPIDAGALRVCPRAYYASSAYRSVSESTPTALKKLVGSQWLVGRCAGAVQEVVIAVSASATDAPLDEDGRIADFGKGNLLPMGVPVGVEVRMLPESAAIFVADQTNSRIKAVPRLEVRAYPFSAIAAVWSVDLESPVEALGRESGAVRRVQTVATGHLNGWGKPLLVAGLPAASQIDEVVLNYPDNTRGTYVMNRRATATQALEPLAVRGR
jgi:hypothetical protein